MIVHFQNEVKSTGFHKQPHENSFVHCSTAAQKGTEYRVTGMNSVTDLSSSLHHSTDTGLQNINKTEEQNLYTTSSCNASFTLLATLKNGIFIIENIQQTNFSQIKINSKPHSCNFYKSLTITEFIGQKWTCYCPLQKV